MGTAPSSTALVAPAPGSGGTSVVVVAAQGAEPRSESLSSHGPAKRSALGGFTEHPVESNKKNAKDTGEGLYIFPEPARHRVLESVFEVPPTTDDIGRGHYGVVRKGYRKADRMPVAVKTIPKKRVVYVEMLRSEVAILRALSGWSDVDSMPIPAGAEGPLDAGVVSLKNGHNGAGKGGTAVMDGPPMPIPSHMGPGLEDQSIVNHVDLARVLAECTGLPLAGAHAAEGQAQTGETRAPGSDASSSLGKNGARSSAAAGPAAVAPLLASLQRVTALAAAIGNPIGKGKGTAKVAPAADGSDAKQAHLDDATRLPRWSDGSVVRLVDAFEDSKQAHLVFELCTGGELYEPIADSSYRFSEPQAARIMRQLLLAVRACHDADIVHRDLKPENILLLQPGVDCDVRIIDFGLATTCRAQDSLIRHVGTPYYIAPEILEPPYGKSCDLWSCGVIAFTLLCGYPPFFGDSEKEIYGRIRRGQYRFEGPEWDRKGMKDHRSMSSREFIAALLARDPAKRLTAQQALCHPWIQWEGDVPTLPIALGLAERDRLRGADTLLRLLRSFGTQPFLKKAALRALLSAGAFSHTEFSVARPQPGGLRPPSPVQQGASAAGEAGPAGPAAAEANAGRADASAGGARAAAAATGADTGASALAPAGSTAVVVRPHDGPRPAGAGTGSKDKRVPAPKRSAYEMLCDLLDIPVAAEGGSSAAQKAARLGADGTATTARGPHLSVPSLPVYSSCAYSGHVGHGLSSLQSAPHHDGHGAQATGLTAVAASAAAALTRVLIGRPGSTLHHTGPSAAHDSAEPAEAGGGGAGQAPGTPSGQHEAQGLAFLSTACSPAMSALLESMWTGCEVMQVLPGYLPMQDGGVSWNTARLLHASVARRQTVHSSAFDLHAATAGMVGLGPRQMSLLLTSRSLGPPSPAEVQSLLWSVASYVQWEHPAPGPGPGPVPAASPALGPAPAAAATTPNGAPQPAVGFYDLCAALLPRLCWLDPPCLLRAFTLLDVDGDGVISPTDLCGCPGLWTQLLQPGGAVDPTSALCAALCGRSGSSDLAAEAAARSALYGAAQALVAECDVDGDGVIDLREFFALMTGNERARL